MTTEKQLSIRFPGKTDKRKDILLDGLRIIAWQARKQDLLPIRVTEENYSPLYAEFQEQWLQNEVQSMNMEQLLQFLQEIDWTESHLNT
ncbi:MAG TPA: hypothetical protein V6C58_07580, partial [Allocoleopsis sp.]